MPDALRGPFGSCLVQSTDEHMIDFSLGHVNEYGTRKYYLRE